MIYEKLARGGNAARVGVGTLVGDAANGRVLGVGGTNQGQTASAAKRIAATASPWLSRGAGSRSNIPWAITIAAPL
jgi:hypothetical protein